MIFSKTGVIPAQAGIQIKNLLDSRIRGNDALTTFDLLKTFAVIFMIIDHVGFYFLTPAIDAGMGDPHLWLRAVGRWCVPIWFFLIGYGRSGVIPLSLMIGAGALTVMNFVTGMFLFPLNALISMMIIRLIIPYVVRFAFASREGMGVTIIMIGMGYLITNDLFEYGTVGLLMAMMGYMMREWRDRTDFIARFNQRVLKIGAVVAVAAVILSQYSTFQFDVAQGVVMATGTTVVFAILFVIRPTTYPLLSNHLPVILRRAVQGCGRRTMEIYVIHLTVFKVVALVFGLGYPIYGWFDWDLTIYGAFQNAN